MRRFLISLLAAIALRGQVTVTATRAAQTPIIGPGETWASSGRFNPAAVRVGDKTVLSFAPRCRRHLRIGYADSPDGLHFTARLSPCSLRGRL